MNESFYYSPAVRQLFLEDEVKIIKQNYATKKYVNDVSGEGVDLTEYPTKTEVADTYATKTMIYKDGDDNKDIIIKRKAPTASNVWGNVVVGANISDATGSTSSGSVTETIGNIAIGDKAAIKDITENGIRISPSYYNTVIGVGSSISGGVDNVVIGNYAYSRGSRNTVVIGNSARINLNKQFENSIAIGPDAQCYDIDQSLDTALNEGGYAIAIGSKAKANCQAVGIGNTASAASKWSVAIGYNAQAKASKSIAIGYMVDNTDAGSVMLGDIKMKHVGNTIVFSSQGKSYTMNLT
jgi:hypothetical protein